MGVDDLWFVLRTASRGTIPLASSLASAGYDVWTPVEVRSKRRPRSKSRVEVRVPIIASYVFARAHQLGDLIRLSADPARNQDFSVLCRHDGVPRLIPDDTLEPLRSAERRTAPKPPRQQFRPGEKVRVPDGSFGGMTGTVEKISGQFAMVGFGGNVRVKISTWLLQADNVDRLQPATGFAAKAA